MTATIPSIDDEDVEVHQPSVDATSDDPPLIHSTNKGKRKARSDDEFDD